MKPLSTLQNPTEQELESTDLLAREERDRKVERLYQILALAQEDWAATHDARQSTDVVEKDATPAKTLQEPQE